MSYAVLTRVEDQLYGLANGLGSRFGDSLGDCDEKDWTQVQKSLNGKLRAAGFPVVSEDGKMCCGYSKTGKLMGTTWNSLVWWIGPNAVTGSPSGMVSAINGRSSPVMLEVPKGEDVLMIQKVLGTKQDGCLGNTVATKLTSRLGSGWLQKPLKDAYAALTKSTGVVEPVGPKPGSSSTVLPGPSPLPPKKAGVSPLALLAIAAGALLLFRGSG